MSSVDCGALSVRARGKARGKVSCVSKMLGRRLACLNAPNWIRTSLGHVGQQKTCLRWLRKDAKVLSRILHSAWSLPPRFGARCNITLPPCCDSVGTQPSTKLPLCACKIPNIKAGPVHATVPHYLLIIIVYCTVLVAGRSRVNESAANRPFFTDYYLHF